MTDRIDLTKLRNLIGHEGRAPRIDRDTLLALIDAIEAAHAYEPLPDEWSNGDERNALRQALDRFDHT